MGVLATVLPVVGLFWLLVHGLHHYSIRLSTPRLETTLPVPSSSRRTRVSSRNITLTLQHFYLRIETSKFNDVQHQISLGLSRKIHPRLRRILALFYDTGSFLGLIGTLSALILLLVTVTRSISALAVPQAITDNVPVTTSLHTMSKRDSLVSTVKRTAYPSDSPLHLIIPGVTVPLTHLPLLLVALFMTQVIHELGHACSAALEGVPLLSVGTSLMVLIPSAFVSLSTPSMLNLSTQARLRVISAGAFHNLVFWLILTLSLRVGLGRLWWSILGYEDVGHFGRVVITTYEDSPLSPSLPGGTVITSLDDLQLTSSETSVDLWSLYLSREQSQDYEIGWCVGTEWFLKQDESCCTAPRPGSNTACFVMASDPFTRASQLRRCAPTLSIVFPESTPVKRCSLSADCGDHHLCAKPTSGTELVRIGVWTPKSRSHPGQQGISEAQVVIWSGPREEVLNEVTVGVYLPRYSWLPLYPPRIMATFIEYMLALSLSLYLFNLLPLPFLDGSQLIDVLLDHVSGSKSLIPSRSSSQHDLEVGLATIPRSQQPSTQWRQRAMRALHILSGTLVGICIITGAILAIRT